jgi:hypothetical protein
MPSASAPPARNEAASLWAVARTGTNSSSNAMHIRLSETPIAAFKLHLSLQKPRAVTA